MGLLDKIQAKLVKEHCLHHKSNLSCDELKVFGMKRELNSVMLLKGIGQLSAVLLKKRKLVMKLKSKDISKNLINCFKK